LVGLDDGRLRVSHRKERNKVGQGADVSFFSVSLSAKHLGEQFGKDTKAITTSITLTLLFRSLGALIFGVLADRFGRKWTLVCNLLLIAVFELGSGFCNTYEQFLAVRSLFGVAMGGIWGQAAA
jgi:SHS family lactate transporter-like MFS transporter